MLTNRVTFGGVVLPMLLVTPQLAITLVFFVWPASQAIYQSVMQEDPFGLKREFVGLANFERLFGNEAYLQSFGITAVFSLAVAALALRSEEHTSELQSHSDLVCRLLLEKKKKLDIPCVKN